MVKYQRIIFGNHPKQCFTLYITLHLSLVIFNMLVSVFLLTVVNVCKPCTYNFSFASYVIFESFVILSVRIFSLSPINCQKYYIFPVHFSLNFCHIICWASSYTWYDLRNRQCILSVSIHEESDPHNLAVCIVRDSYTYYLFLCINFRVRTCSQTFTSSSNVSLPFDILMLCHSSNPQHFPKVIPYVSVYLLSLYFGYIYFIFRPS